MADPAPAHDPRVPGKSRLQEAMFALAFGTLSIGVLGAIAYYAEAAFIFPSLGPTAFLLFHRPTASAASPRNTLIGHAIGAFCGFAALAACGLIGAPSALEGGTTLRHALAAGLSLGSTSALMVFLDRGHPPAGATTLIISLGLFGTIGQVMTLLTAVVLLILQGHIIHRLAGTSYPIWAPPTGPHHRPR